MSTPDKPEAPKRKPLSAEEKQARIVLQKATAQAALQDYRDAEQKTRDRMARLRAERLAREQAEEN
ncbi:MAG: hypothetical protein P8Z80_01015 [Pseudolabrys sp.]|jgi:hypothetical protein